MASGQRHPELGRGVNRIALARAASGGRIALGDHLKAVRARLEDPILASHHGIGVIIVARIVARTVQKPDRPRTTWWVARMTASDEATNTIVNTVNLYASSNYDDPEVEFNRTGVYIQANHEGVEAEYDEAVGTSFTATSGQPTRGTLPQIGPTEGL